MFNNYKNMLFNKFKNTAEKVMPTLKDNNFSKTGILTPDEFVKAGDYLVEKYPNWSWFNTQTGHKTMNFLPKNKQMLICNRVFCNKNQNILLEEDSEGIIVARNVDDEKIETVKEDESEDDLDLGEFELDEDFDDIAGVKGEIDGRNYYNLSITYDNYFRTPRLWLMGFDSSNYPLSNNKIYKDISIEHSKITVTIENHPFYKDIQYISVHPCKHSHVMKRLLEEGRKNGKEIGVEEYFLYFLKFVSTVMPNLDFDRTKIQ